MQAEHVWLRTDAAGRLVDPPTLPPCSRIEAILRVVDTPDAKGVRVPPVELASITRIRGDLVEPGAAPEDWDSLQ